MHPASLPSLDNVYRTVLYRQIVSQADLRRSLLTAQARLAWTLAKNETARGDTLFSFAIIDKE